MEGRDGQILRPFVSIFSRWLDDTTPTPSRPVSSSTSLGSLSTEANASAEHTRRPLYEIDISNTAPSLCPARVTKMSRPPEPSDLAIDPSHASETTSSPPIAMNPEVPLKSPTSTIPAATRTLKRKRPAFLDKLKEPRAKATSRYAPSLIDESHETLSATVPSRIQAPEAAFNDRLETDVQRMRPVQTESVPSPNTQKHGTGKDPPSIHAQEDTAIYQKDDEPILDELPALPTSADKSFESHEAVDDAIKDQGITSSLSILSHTPELSETPVPGSSGSCPRGFTSYVVDSDEGDNSDGSGIALEEDTAAPTHEPRVERSLTSFDSDSDSSVFDFEALKRGPSNRRSSPTKSFPGSSKPHVKNRILSSATFTELVRQTEDDAERNRRIREARLVLETSSAGDTTPTTSTDGRFLAALVNDNDDAGVVDRMKQAMDRTDVMVEDTCWQFFSKIPPIACPSLFPASLPRAYDWMTDRAFRDQALLSGYARKALCGADLPSELVSWMWDEYFATPQEELAFAYLDCLEDLAAAEMTKTKLEKLLNRWGTRPQVFDQEKMITPDAHYKPVPPTSSMALKRLLGLTWRSSHTVPFETVAMSFEVLLRLALDSSLLAYEGLRGELQHCFCNLLHRLSEPPAEECSSSDIPSSLVRTLKHPVLQWKLISVLPSTSPETHSFAQHLALSFFLDSAGYMTFPLTSTDSLTDRIIKKLHHDTCETKQSVTDYASIAASINILDVAIGNGFGRPDSQASKQERKPFDANVDKVSGALARLSARIIDTGASHMQRTEAKGAVARLIARLEHAVRTEPKPVSHVLDDARWAAANRSQADASGAVQPGRRRTLDTWVQPTKEEPSENGDASVQQDEHMASPDRADGTALETECQPVNAADGGAGEGPGVSNG